ncbi:MAG: 16S rRNA (guanine(1207)-N(2))-methyltransferase RsmC [Buchnera aphidicola (Eriosoma harunire)]
MINTITNESKIINRHLCILKNKNTIFYGDIKDCFSLSLPLKYTNVYTTKYNIWNQLYPYMYNNIQYNYKISNQKNVELIIYYWPKDKKEALFHIQYLCSYDFIKCKILITGNNRSGIKNAPKLLKSLISIQKLDTAKHSILYLGTIQKKIIFTIKNTIKTYFLSNIKIKVFPGVFGYSGLDQGSLLLISTFSKKISGKILDIGCGTGILSMMLYQKTSKVKLHLIDSNLIALKSSKINLRINNIPGKLYPSDLFSNVNDKFDLILSNPPIHDGIQFTTLFIEKMIKESKKHLKPHGELRFVTPSGLMCQNLLKKYFIYHYILLHKKKFIVYQGFDYKKTN